MTDRQQNILLTGGAGFIGSHLADRLLSKGCQITVLDNFNSFYDPKLKQANISSQLVNPQYRLVEGDLRNPEDLKEAFASGPFDTVVHLAAMAGVRPSLKNPSLYMDVNVMGTQHLLDIIVAQTPMPFLLFCSSSSVYGERSTEQFLETDQTDRPLSPYAASKIAAEAACFAAHRTTDLEVVCVRPFTVFGPRQRPDLAIHKFCQLMESDKPIEIYGDGTSKRDYTFVADIVNGLESAISLRGRGFEVINLGRSKPVSLTEMIAGLEKALGKRAQIVRKPFQIGDVPYTYACIDKARLLLGYEPSTSLDDGIAEFVKWYRKAKCASAARS